MSSNQNYLETAIDCFRVEVRKVKQKPGSSSKQKGIQAAKFEYLWSLSVFDPKTSPASSQAESLQLLSRLFKASKTISL